MGSKKKCAIHFVEVKSGQSNLNNRQKNIKNAILEGKVHWHEYNVDGIWEHETKDQHLNTKKNGWKDIILKPVLKRLPPGDRWTPLDNDQPILSSLTEGIEWVFQNESSKPTDYVLKAAEGKVYIYSEEEIPEPEPPQPKTYNLYGEYE